MIKKSSFASVSLVAALLLGGSLGSLGSASGASTTSAQTAAVQSVAADVSNIATAAIPSASYTASWNSVLAVNNGVTTFSGGNQTDLWGTWSENRPATQWLQYDWDATVTISGSKIAFWTDAAAGTGANVAVPKAWSLQYRTSSTGAWIDVPSPSGYPVVRGAVNDTTFPPISATSLRATFQASPNAGVTAYAGVGVSEWQVIGEFYTDPNMPFYVEELHVPTLVGTVPTLPASAIAIFEDGRRQVSAATWPAIQASQVAQAGSFKVTGSAADVSGPISATVWVRSSNDVTLTGLDPLSVITAAKRKPLLPTTVVGTYSDGSKDSSLPVSWAPIKSADYAAEGAFEVVGTVAGTTLKASALVIVDVANGEVEPDETTTTLSIPQPQVSTKDVLVATVKVTSPVPFEGTVELWDGATKIGENPIYSHTGGTVANPLYEGTAIFREVGSGLATGKRMHKAQFVSTSDEVAGSSSAEAAVDVYLYDSKPGSKFYDEILWLSGSGITTGNTDGSFQPTAQVSRQAMAAFLYRMKNPGVAAPACTARPFTDVPADSRFCPEIAWLKTQNITTGFAGGTFQPGGNIDRQAMAAFLFRLQNPGAAQPTCSTAPFTDVPVNSQFCGEIDWLKSQEITTGYDGGTFHPAEKVARMAMAAFLYRLAGPDQGNDE